MKASEYIERYVQEAAQPYAQVVVSYARKMTHIPLKPDALMPDEDDSNITVFIQLDTNAMPPVLIPDHNCDGGIICGDHPDQQGRHDGCYGEPIRCPYPGCGKEPGIPMNDKPATSEDSELKHLGAGS